MVHRKLGIDLVDGMISLMPMTADTQQGPEVEIMRINEEVEEDTVLGGNIWEADNENEEG